MKTISKINKNIMLLSLPMLLFSCQKDKLLQETDAIAKVNFINAVVGAGNVKANISSRAIYWNSISDNQSVGGYSINRMFIVPTEKSTILKVVPQSDTTQVWYSKIINLKPGKMYSLYLSGSVNKIDTLFREESNFPKFIIRDPGRSIPATDSVVNIRFVNLSSSGPAVDINIEGQNTNEASNLGYRKFTDFKVYPATREVQGISLEIRRSSNKELLATTYVDVSKYGNLFKTLDIVIKGIYDPDWSLPIPDEDRYMLLEVPYQ